MMATERNYVWNQLICLFIFTILTLSIGYEDHVGYSVIHHLDDPSLHIQNILHREKRAVDNDTVTTKMPTPATGMTTEKIRLEEDIHKYYKVSYFIDDEASANWIDLDTMQEGGKQTHDTLSRSHKTAATVKLSFTFIFYGHEVKQVTIATGGFLYLSDFLHQWLTATQYIAPLMANFDLQLGDTSNIHYVDNTTHFAVQWENVYLQDLQSAGKFNFQVVLGKDGRIWFGYKDIPVQLDHITEGAHPVKVGLSDAYYIDTTSTTTNVKRRTIYEYHRVEISKGRVLEKTAILIEPLPSCIMQKSCGSCETAYLPSFDCRWCEDLHRCSDGLDRFRQEWLKKGCDTVDYLPSQCPPSTYFKLPETTTLTNHIETHAPKNTPRPTHNIARTSASGYDNQPAPAGPCQEVSQVGQCQTVHPAVIAVIVIIIVALIGVLVGWIVYAYRNPNSTSGRWMIEHRPSELKRKMQNIKVNFFNRGENTGDKYAVSVSQGNESVA